MDTWKITPLNLGTLQVTSGAQVYKHGVRQNVGEVLTVPCIGWLLQNDSTGEKMMVDAGPAEDDQWGSTYHNPIKVKEEQKLEYALMQHGVRPEEITVVILTHLHWDHAYGVLKLPQAKVYVQKEELRYAVSPLPPDSKHYELNIKSQLPFFLQFFHQMQLLNGDCTIASGLEVVALPGHSPGSQGVVIHTKNGRYLIAGDLINDVDNWEKRLPGGLYCNMADCYASFEKIERLNVQVLPSHDYAAFELLKEN